MASWVVRAGSTLTPVPVTQKTGTSRTSSQRDVSGGQGQVRCDRSPVEQQRRVLRRVELAEDDRREQFLRGADVRRIDPEPGQGLPHEVAEAVRPDLGQYGGAPPQARSADGDVGGGAAQELGERRDVLERARLLRVDVHAHAADREQLRGGQSGGHRCPHELTYLSIV